MQPRIEEKQYMTIKLIDRHQNTGRHPVTEHTDEEAENHTLTLEEANPIAECWVRTNVPKSQKDLTISNEGLKWLYSCIRAVGKPS